MTSLVPFFIILVAGLIFSEMFNRLHLPYVVALIIAGIIIGPSGFGLVEINETIFFLGSIGVIFLMFIAGSEIKSNPFSNPKMERTGFALAFLNALIPFSAGLALAYAFGYPFNSGLVLATIFVSSSVAVIIPALENSHLIHTRLGQTIISATIIEDILSLVVFAIVLQHFTQSTVYPPIVFVPMVFLIILVLNKVIPFLNRIYHTIHGEKEQFENEIRFVFVTLLATVILFESIGLHALVAGFVLGMSLGDSIKDKVEEKVKTISYGFFIPIFFLVIGLQTDLSIFFSTANVTLTLCIIAALLISKIFSGYLSGRMTGFSSTESLFMGVSTTPQVSTTLAAAFTAAEIGLLKPELITALIILSTATTFIAPIGIDLLASKVKIQTTFFEDEGE